MATFKIYCLSNFLTYSTNYSHHAVYHTPRAGFITGTLYLLIIFIYSFTHPHLHPGGHQSVLWVWCFVLNSTHEWLCSIRLGLTSLCTTPWRSIHDNTCQDFPFFNGGLMFHWYTHTHTPFPYSSTDGHLGCLHVSVIVNNATTNVEGADAFSN